jgi:Dockerin type I repeat.
MNGRTRWVALLLAILMVVFMLPAVADGEALSGEFAETNQNTGEMLLRVGWTLDAEGKALTLTYVDSVPEVGRRTPVAADFAEAIAERTGKTAKEVLNGIESLKLVGFDVAGGELWSLNNLRSIDFGTVSIIENDAFDSLPIEELTIPGTVKTLASFAECASLRRLCIEEGVEQIAFGAFQNCPNLTEVSIPNSVRRIGLNAFMGTPWLENQKDEFVVVGDGVLIRYNGTGKTELTIPAGIKAVCCMLGYSSPFRFIANNFDENDYPESFVKTNPDLRTVVFGPDVKEIYGACYLLRKLETVVLPDGLESIGAYSFYYCNSLKTLTVPESVRYLFWKRTFGGEWVDPEGFAGETNPADGHAYAPTPAVTFLGAPPVMHPDENPSWESHVMWNGDGQSMGEMSADLGQGVIWHLRCSLTYADEWLAFAENPPAYAVLMGHGTFVEQYDLQPYFLNGDMNLSGTVTATDAVLILRHVVGLERLSEEARALADVNGDGRITAGDAAMILRHIVGLIAAL